MPSPAWRITEPFRRRCRPRRPGHLFSRSDMHRAVSAAILFAAATAVTAVRRQRDERAMAATAATPDRSDA